MSFTSSQLPENLISSASPSSSSPSIPDIGPKIRLAYGGGKFFIWSIEDIIRLRSKGHLAVTAIGICSLKLATKGKAAAIPAILSDEELYVCWKNDWVEAYDENGLEVDVKASLDNYLMDVKNGDADVRRLVFHDLWMKGYRCTNGIKFGVHFLTYRSDPTAVHAGFMVIVAREGEGIAPLDLIARSRVATTALKICVMAWADITTGSVQYAAFKRMGPGTAIFEDEGAQRVGMAAGDAFLVSSK